MQSQDGRAGAHVVSTVVPWPAHFWVFAVLVELLIGLLFVIGIGYSKATWLLSLVFLSCLIVLATTLALSGESTCGCFGRVPLAPISAVSLDAVAIVLLLIAKPRFERRELASQQGGFDHEEVGRLIRAVAAILARLHVSAKTDGA